MLYYEGPFQDQQGAMAFLEAHGRMLPENVAYAKGRRGELELREDALPGQCISICWIEVALLIAFIIGIGHAEASE